MHVLTVSVRTLSTCVDCFSEDLECIHVLTVSVRTFLP